MLKTIMSMFGWHPSAIETLFAEVDQEVNRRNYEVVVAIMNDTNLDRVCAWAAVHSKLLKVSKALKKSQLAIMRPSRRYSRYKLDEYGWEKCVKMEYQEYSDRTDALTKEREELQYRLHRLEKCGRCSVCRHIRRYRLKLDPTTLKPLLIAEDDGMPSFIAEGGEGE